MITALILNTLFLLTPLDRPVLTVAVGHVESRNNVKAKGKAGEKGAFQVIQKEHGKVPQKWKKQADQHEWVLDEFIQMNKGDLSKGVQSYNGSIGNPKTKVYLGKVRRTAFQIHFLA